MNEIDEHDRALIEKANNTSRWDYRRIKDMVDDAHSEETRDILWREYWRKHDLMEESL